MKYFQLIAALAFCLFLQVSPGFGAVEQADTEAASEIKSDEIAKASTIDDAVDAGIIAEISQHAPADAPTAGFVVTERRPVASSNRSRLALTPMLGGNFYPGRYAYHIGNSFSLGLGVEVPLSRLTSLEFEGDYGDYNVTYSNFIHDFSTYTLGSNFKAYLVREGSFRPYVGTGLIAQYYNNMYATPAFRYNHTVGSAQLMAGGEYQVERLVAVGIRTGWVVPCINKADVRSQGGIAMPGFEDASVINKDYFRILGTVKITM